MGKGKLVRKEKLATLPGRVGETCPDVLPFFCHNLFGPSSSCSSIEKGSIAFLSSFLRCSLAAAASLSPLPSSSCLSFVLSSSCSPLGTVGASLSFPRSLLEEKSERRHGKHPGWEDWTFYTSAVGIQRVCVDDG